MTDLVIKLDRRTNRYSVYRTGEFARYVTSFPTLHEAEQYVIEHSDIPRDCDPGMLGAS